MRDRAEDGTITIEEVEKVASDLSDKSQLYRRLFIIGRSMYPEFVPTLEKYVFDRENLSVAALCLDFLFIYHGRDEYKDVVIKFIQGVPWDKSDDLRAGALFIAGHKLSKSQDKQILKAAIEALDRNSERTQYAAYTAILQAAGLTWKQMPFTPVSFTRADIDNALVDRMRQRLQ